MKMSHLRVEAGRDDVAYVHAEFAAGFVPMFLEPGEELVSAHLLQSSDLKKSQEVTLNWLHLIPNQIIWVFNMRITDIQRLPNVFIPMYSQFGWTAMFWSNYSLQITVIFIILNVKDKSKFL